MTRDRVKSAEAVATSGRFSLSTLSRPSVDTHRTEGRKPRRAAGAEEAPVVRSGCPMADAPPRRTLYPPIELVPHRRLPVSEVHDPLLRGERNPDGKPVLFLHGGPGSGLTVTFLPSSARASAEDHFAIDRDRPRKDPAGTQGAGGQHWQGPANRCLARSPSPGAGAYYSESLQGSGRGGVEDRRNARISCSAEMGSCRTLAVSRRTPGIMSIP